jgi:hypothetical protein
MLLLVLPTVCPIPPSPAFQAVRQSGTTRCHECHPLAPGAACKNGCCCALAVHATRRCCCSWLAAAPTGARWLAGIRQGSCRSRAPASSWPCSQCPGSSHKGRNPAGRQAHRRAGRQAQAVQSRRRIHSTCTYTAAEISLLTGEGHAPRSAKCTLYWQQHAPSSTILIQYKMPEGPSWLMVCWWQQELKTDNNAALQTRCDSPPHLALADRAVAAAVC